ncbi:MAG: HD domain-containing protein [Treponema sp.]|jgi:HD superfamily phosphohydrolase|nr:HD domain-containing protein [Treponema sp.]
MKSSIEASLIEDFTHPIRDVLWGHIYMTGKFAALTESASFLRLNRIMQLGSVCLVYPGATHTRASHSIGVYHIGKRLLQNLIQRGASQWLTHEGAKSFLAACLLHDLGHFPYTHSLKELSLLSHEALSAAIILKDPMRTLVSATGADPELVAAIIDKEINNQGTELLFYRKLLSGALDPDKLDYLNRDARYCGVPYGAQDVDFILSRLYPNKTRGVDIDSRLIPNVEAVLFSKYLMYRTVYWHKQVRAATAMVKKALINGLESGYLTSEELYNLDDNSLFTLIKSKNKIKKELSSDLVDAVFEGRIFITAAEISCKNTGIIGPRNADLWDIKKRAKLEEQVAALLRADGLEISGEDLIIDIPEPVSFETGLYILDEECYFNDSSSAFNTKTVNAFIQTLFTIRLFINQKFKEIIKTFPQICSILDKVTQ